MSAETSTGQKPDSVEIITAYVTGAGSIIDISGDYRKFRDLTFKNKEFRNNWEAIASDFDAVGEYLENAIIEYFRRLPKEEQANLVKKMIKSIEEKKRVGNENNENDRMEELIEKEVRRLSNESRSGGEE